MEDEEMKQADETPRFEGISSKNRSTESWPWVEKYRPSSLNDLIAHQEIVSTLNRLIDAQKLPHLLFYGPPGTGKTSMIIAAARRLYGKSYGSMVLEVRWSLGWVSKGQRAATDEDAVSNSSTPPTTVVSMSCATRSKSLPVPRSSLGVYTGIAVSMSVAAV
jgi:hypothetical protein